MLVWTFLVKLDCMYLEVDSRKRYISVRCVNLML